MRSFAETSQFQENFEVYIQALISQCLDANFLDEVFADQGKSIASTFISSFLKLFNTFFCEQDLSILCQIMANGAHK